MKQKTAGRKGGTVGGRVSLGDSLRSARRAVDWSQEELASRMKVGLATVSSAEAGRAPRHSTLDAYLRVLPGLSAHVLLDAPPYQAPVASSSVWALARAQYGFWAKRLKRTVNVVSPTERETLIEMTGILTTQADLADPLVRTAVMRAACVGSNASLRKIEAADTDFDGDAILIEDGDLVHEFSFPKSRRSLRLHGFRYTRRPLPSTDRKAPGGAGEALSTALDGTLLALDFPVRRVELRVCFPDKREAAVRCFAWPRLLPPDPGDGEIAARLHPKGVDLRIAKGSATLVLERPLPGLRYGLGWPRDPDILAMRGGVGAKEERCLADTMRKLREESGLSLRAAGDRVGLPFVTIRHVEKGGNPQLKTLQAYLGAFPDLAPQDVLPSEPAEGLFSRDALWDYQRQLFGFHARSHEKVLRIDAEGDCDVSIESQGLRSLRGSTHELKIRIGLQRAVLQDAPLVLAEIQAEHEDIKTRRIRKKEGGVEHQFTFPRDDSEGGLTYHRRYETRRMYSLHRSAEEKEEEVRIFEGTSLPVHFPCERICLSVEFPKGYQPSELTSNVWPNVLIPDPELPFMSDEFRHAEPELDTRRGILTARLTVERPLVGFKYSLGWCLD